MRAGGRGKTYHAHAHVAQRGAQLPVVELARVVGVEAHEGVDDVGDVPRVGVAVHAAARAEAVAAAAAAGATWLGLGLGLGLG